MSRMLPFAYYGGKYRHLNFLLPLFPTEGIDHFVDVFGGSASVILNLKHRYFLETYNDIDSQLCNFFKVLREVPDFFVSKLSLTPHSREEFMNAYEADLDKLDRIERAHVFWVKITQSRDHWPNTNKAYWKHRKRKSGRVRDPRIILNKIAGLNEIADRLMTVSIENMPALEIIKKYDTERSFFYCDPPYVPDTRSGTGQYKYEMTEDDHRELHGVLSDCSAKVIVSGYDSDLYADLYKDWHFVKDKETRSLSGSGIRTVAECAWLNFERPIKQLDIFDENS